MPQISGLGDVGLYCNDLDLERRICSLSAAPDTEHHELALVLAKGAAQRRTTCSRPSFKVTSLDDVRSTTGSWTPA
jgi:hypothetical protein